MERMVLPRMAILPAVLVGAATLTILVIRAGLEGRPGAFADLLTAVTIGVVAGVVTWVVLGIMIASELGRIASSGWGALMHASEARVRWASAASSGPAVDFDQFDESARRVLTNAQDEAMRLDHNYIGTEHLLLGILRDPDGLACAALMGVGADVDKARWAVEFIVGRGDRHVSGEVGLTPRAKRVLELAVEEARDLGNASIAAEHLLLGIVREREGIAAGVLESLGVASDAVRTEVARLHGRADG
jgi:hypothetical protein